MRQQDDLYLSEEYLQNTGNWHVEDSGWKANLIYQLYRKNQLAPKLITEVGCGAGAILETLQSLDPSIQKLTGFDISPQAIKLAEGRANEKLSFYQQDFLEADTPHADLILVIDVLEHLQDFYGFLRHLSSRGERFIFHVPMDLSCRTILKPHVLKQHRDSVGHIHYFSEEMIFWMLGDTGYEILDWQYTKPVIDVLAVKGVKAQVKKKLRNFSYSLNPALSAKLWGGYSLLILASPKSNHNT